jgi:hypothetical protein
MTDARTPAPSTLATVVAAAARAGDPSDPDTLRAAAHDARLAEASRALHDAHLAVADAAGAWYDADLADAAVAWYDADLAANHANPRDAHLREARLDLREAVVRWRAAGDAFVRATRGGA